MFRNKLLRTTAATIGLMAMLSQSAAVMAQSVVTTTNTGLSQAQKVALLQHNIKYVFVIFAENRSFDHYFGTFPGANGLFTAPSGFTPASQMASFSQRLMDTTLSPIAVTPYLIPNGVTALTTGTKNTAGSVVNIYPADTGSVGHAHAQIANAMDYRAGTGNSLNDRYAMTQQALTTTTPGGPLVTTAGVAPTSASLASKQQAYLDIGHVDCDTIPFLWQWANNFVLYDNFHQSVIGPSSANAISLIAGQTGETQEGLHPTEAPVITTSASGQPLGQGYAGNNTVNGSVQSNAYVPVIGDPGPFPGSSNDHATVKPPYNFDESATNTSLNLTFASQPLSFMGSNISEVIAHDQNPRGDLLDVQHDIFAIASFDAPVNWGWYQQGFNTNDAADPFEPQGTGTPVSTGYTGYVLHHNGPQYFGYLADNTQVQSTNLHGNQDFFTAVNGHALPASGVFYLRGGYNNNDGLVPLDPTAAIQHAFLGNDDHPAYSDAQISEAMAAEAIDAIVNSGYWANSVIIITYDETDGLYDHVSPTIHNTLPDGTPLMGGPRVPTIVISPFAATNTISHSYTEHGSIIKFINELFNLVPLANLPDEVRGRNAAAANSALGNPANYGPTDDPNNAVGDLTDAFDYGILQGTKLPLSASLATFTPTQIATLPHLATTPNGLTNGACMAINGGAGILPTDYSSQAAYTNGQPSDAPLSFFNPRPSASPGTPTNGSWTP
jgi:phospholipase C